jgi:hypothetical protein
VDNPLYPVQKREALDGLTDECIDMPIRDLVKGFNRLPYCFTLQCCYGHFVYSGQQDPCDIEPLPTGATIGKVRYRIAYMAFCIENSAEGRSLFESLKAIPAVDPENVQFGCAQWFWNRQVNSYVLQVEPDRFKREDTAIIDFNEALHIETIRNECFSSLVGLIELEPCRLSKKR